MEFAVKVEHGDFTWDSPPPEVEVAKKKGVFGKKQVALKKTDDVEDKSAEKIFNLKDINMEIQKGQLLAIVGKSPFATRLRLVLTLV